MFKPKRLLAPIDFSRESALAVDWAEMIVRGESEAEILLCHVLPRMTAPIGPDAIAFDLADAMKREEAAADERLAEFQSRIPNDIASDRIVCRGRVDSEIERLCNEKSIGLVIMTTHGRRGLSRLLQGSTTEETVRLAPCPVLVLHLNQAMREVVHASSASVGEGWR